MAGGSFFGTANPCLGAGGACVTGSEAGVAVETGETGAVVEAGAGAEGGVGVVSGVDSEQAVMSAMPIRAMGASAVWHVRKCRMAKSPCLVLIVMAVAPADRVGLLDDAVNAAFLLSFSPD